MSQSQPSTYDTGAVLLFLTVGYSIDQILGLNHYAVLGTAVLLIVFGLLDQ